MVTTTADSTGTPPVTRDQRAMSQAETNSRLCSPRMGGRKRLLGQGPPSPQAYFTYEHKQSKGYTSQTLFTRRTPQAGTRNPDTCALVDPALRPKNTNRNFAELGRDSLSQVHQGPPDPGACQPPIPQFSRAGTPSPPLVLSGPQQQLRKPQRPQPCSARRLGPKWQPNPREPVTSEAPTPAHPTKMIRSQISQQVLQQNLIRPQRAIPTF